MDEDEYRREKVRRTEEAGKQAEAKRQADRLIEEQRRKDGRNG